MMSKCTNPVHTLYIRLEMKWCKNMRKTIYFDAFEQSAYEELGQELYNLLTYNREQTQPVIILCIGTDRVTGDSLGPLVGHQLLASTNRFIIYGNLEEPVHAINLIETMEEIYSEYENPYVIAIDASLGSKDHIGYVTLRQGPLKPGQGISKDLPAIGDISITGIVNLSGRPGAFLLQNTRLYTVMKLVDCIASGISHAEALEDFEEILEQDAAGSMEELNELIEMEEILVDLEEISEEESEEQNKQEEIPL